MIKCLPAFYYHSVSAIAMTLCLGTPVQAANILTPRAEVNVRAGTERSILMTEFWAPLAQDSERVVYGDLRLMGDNDSNKEGNLGFGYREINARTNSVLGVNAWIDRRRTERGNNFHQLTLGLESLGETIDLRANAYIQLNNSKTTITPNIGSAAPYLAGSNIFFDTNGFIVEEPQDGFDAEIGYRLPIFQKHIDATRVYAGGYHFMGDTTDNVTGFRLRTEAQVNSIFSVGARFQHDGPRGSQGFLEATLRFPFSAKRSFQEHGLRSRLDESPERDIDIVTRSKIDTGLRKAALNAAGTEQRILYVDNTNVNIGDGTKENPFNTLAAAQSALQSNDIVYVNRGDGTTTGMDQGIVIDKANVQLIGSGSALTYNGFTLLNAGLAPIITNTNAPTASSDVYVGHGVLITENNSFVSGISINAASYNGLRVIADGKNINSVFVQNVTATNNLSTGILATATNNGQIGTVNFVNNNASNNFSTVAAANGISVSASNGGFIDNVVITGNITNANPSQGIHVLSFLSEMNNVLVSNNTSSNNGVAGINTTANRGKMQNVSLENNIANFNQTGIFVNVSNENIQNMNQANNVTNNNTTHGVMFQVVSGSINQTAISNVSSNNNSSNGIFFTVQSNGSLGQVTGTNLTANDNGLTGVNVSVQTNATIGQIDFSNIAAANNSSYGTLFSASGATINSAVITSSTLNTNMLSGLAAIALTGGRINELYLSSIQSNNNNQNGIYFNAQSATSIIGNASLSNSDTLNNGINGIYLYKQNAAAILNGDLGGGSLGSTGQNRSFGNVSKDLQLNYTGGGAVFAKNNWWGINTGLAAGRVTLSVSTTVDATAFLTTDPRP